MKKIYFPFSVRQGNCVSDAVALEVAGKLWGEGQPLPSLLSIRGAVDAPVFHYEEGIVAKVHLVNQGEEWEDWAVTHVTVRYPNKGRRNLPKIEEVWGPEQLLDLKKRRWWWHPHVATT